MRTRRVTGFTLVEILIVVVILGILAAIVIPQFTSASQEAIKGALSSQLQTISSQVELYRVRNAGALPHADPTQALATGDPADENSNNGGWGVLVSQNYLKERPYNGFSGSSAVSVGAATTNPVAQGTKPESDDFGWYYIDAAGSNQGVVYAIGFDGTYLSTEADYDAANTVQVVEEEEPPAP